MYRLILTVVLVLLLSVLFASPAAAQEVAGKCPPGFERHHQHMDGHMHGGHMDGDMHKHAGIRVDLNGDEFLCVKHVSPVQDIHVHIDNNVMRGLE